MPKSKHTPGPWWYGGQSGKKRGFIFAGKTPDGEPMFQLGVAAQDHRLAGGNPEANGLLMAAAPDLLAACKRAVDIFGRLIHKDAVPKMLLDAIAKAEGRADAAAEG